jgi:hypothetical protein
MTKPISWLRALVLMAVVSLFPRAALAVQGHYERELLFSTAYGPGPEQIGVQPGISGDEDEEEPASLWKLCVPAPDAIYVADAVQHRIKRFDAAGRVTAIAHSVLERLDVEGGPAQPEILTDIDFIDDFAATPQGLFFAALGGMNEKVEVFDSTGAPLASLRDARGKITEPRGWDKLLPQVLRRVAHISCGEPDIYSLNTDESGHVYLHVTPAANEYNVSLAKFDPDLNLVGTVPGFMVGWDGRTYGFVPSRSSEPNDRLRVYTAEGTLERTITLRPPEDVSEGDYNSASHQWRGLDPLFDARGDIYLVLNHRRPADQWRQLMPGFKISDDVVVYKFDRVGSFLGRLVLDGLPFWMDPPLAVDPDGNIYHLEYDKDRVDFVKERLVP